MDADVNTSPSHRADAPGQGARHAIRSVIATTTVVLYVLAFCVLPLPSAWIGRALHTYWFDSRNAVQRFMSALSESMGWDLASWHLQVGGYFVITCFLLPWLIMACLGRGRPRDLGWRMPNRLTWRIVGCAIVLSIPFSVWMVSSPDFAKYYRPRLAAGTTVMVLYYFVVMFGEHFLFHGVLLAALRKGLRWPDPPRQDRSAHGRFRRVLQWLGLAQPTDGASGVRYLTRWLGLKDGCGRAILVSGLLFGAAHIGKDPRELALSFPGGVIVAYLAYRCNSWFAPLVLHLVTAGTAYLMMVLEGSL